MSKIQVEIYRQGMACQSQYRNTQLKLVPLLPTNVVQAKAEEYIPESTRATTNTWPYYRYRETAGKLDLVAVNINLFSHLTKKYTCTCNKINKSMDLSKHQKERKSMAQENFQS